MNEVVKVIKLQDDINEVLRARSRELDRREAFDREISKQIQTILNKRKNERKRI